MPRTIHRNSLLAATVALAILGWGALGIVRSQNAPNFEPFREYFYQPRYSITEQILKRHDSLLKVILAERSALLWGEKSATYTPQLLGMRIQGLYASDSNFIQRRACWLSSLFARDVDFVEVSAYSVDGRVSLREMYAINRDNERWAVVDSAGFPLFERCITVSAQDTAGRDGLRDFLLTLLSYAGYGSYNLLGTADSVYHGINLSEALEDKYYPFEISQRADTTVVRFTSCLRGGVEVSRWGISLANDGVLIEESEQLVTFEDLPERVDTSHTALAGRNDTSAIGALLTDVTGETTGDTTGDTTADTAGATDTETHPEAPGGVRLADLLAGRANATPSQGTVSYEVLSFKPLIPTDSSAELTGPEFVNFVQPQYPPLAYQQKQQDKVELMVRVDSLGKARQAMVVARPEHRGVGFDVNAKLAATKCVFRPGTVNGKAVDMWLTYRITYRLGGETGAAIDPSTGSSGTPDSLALDTLPNSQPVDTAVADTVVSDTTSDTASAETPQTDSSVADTTTTDSAHTDTMTADTAVIDSTPADSTVNDSAG